MLNISLLFEESTWYNILFLLILKSS